ncbi:hypothetical protein FA13DRAFT_1519903 [Coprinellus micaceus]|uniref:F-box domain-containing protein n=1 Tax=Coprinellus micaceus TaxID=71717 RepID=A0A4Y7SKN7_COPMI|nr:hypothetical protein FA13DRAFT_1519903 [Coprinellus micaceus]
MSSTVDLPMEIWVKIALDADPFDVVFLAQTCTALYTFLANESVWMAILGNVMRKYGDFMVSYSIDEMSVQALQKAASGPYRWKALLEKLAVPDHEIAPTLPIQPVMTREWHGAPKDFGDLHYQANYYLVPGGRFLVSQGFEVDESLPPYSEGCVQPIVTLWDLGASGSEDQPIRLTTKVLAHLRSYMGFSVAKKTDRFRLIESLKFNDFAINLACLIYPD